MAVSTRTERWLQRQHLSGGGFGFRRSVEFCQRCRQQAVGHTKARIGQSGATGGNCRFLVSSAYENAEGNCGVTCIGKPVKGAESQRTLGPVDRTLRLARKGQENAAKE